MKLLIVEDHAAMRRMIGRVVNDMISDIKECDDGAEALAAYDEYRPDCVLMDIEMNRMGSQPREKSSWPSPAPGL